ncbi:MAG TPA: malonic semialdehyde reductase [Hyphomicrobiaceae bacterium]|jgi:3-hydroxypropanoate dehydrogenase|nr:malonic semialdehyde reductase [Hyphomicrobiaceae bacterium]
MAQRLDDSALGQLFLEARTHRAWLPIEVPDAVLVELVDLMKWGPTASNTLPARIVFVRSKSAKERLRPLLAEGNRERTMLAPACAIIGYDAKFYERPPQGQEPMPGFAQNPSGAETAAMRNSSLQGGYFVLAARALGLDAGPMSGFDNAGVDKEFFAGTDIKSNFLCNLGYGDPPKLRPRGPRFAFAQMASII